MATARALTFADLLRRHRSTAGLSQEELAARAGLSRSGISELERGLKRAPHKDTVARLADALALDGAERARFEAAARGRAAAQALQALGTPTAVPQHHAADRPRAPVPFVGRTRERARIERFLGQDRPSFLLLLSGEPGIGKSRLLREAVATARAAGWAVLEGGCQQRSGQPPFAPLLEALAVYLARRTPAQLRVDLTGAAWLARLLPELAETAVVPAPRWTLPPEQERRLMFAAVARFLANIAGSAGTLLVLDDLQWAGTDALNLLGSLATLAQPESDPNPPLRILGAYRSTETPAGHPLSHLLADLARDDLADEVPLVPLMQGEARALVEGLLAPALVDASTHRELVDRLLERAGGVPFYLVSCARAALAVRERGAEAAADGVEEGADDALPWDAAQSIRQRLALLPAVAADLVRVVAVAGRQIERATLEALAGWLRLDPRATAQALEATLHARLLLEEVPHRAGLPSRSAAGAAGEAGEERDGAYRFAHDLIREVAAAELGAWRRRAAHRVIAEALETHLPERAHEQRAAELAHHFARGGEPARAASYALHAGAHAEHIFALAEALHQYRMAVALAETSGEHRLQAEAHDRLGCLLLHTVQQYVAQAAGVEEEAIAHLEQAVTRYQELAALEDATLATSALAEVYASTGQYETGLDLLNAVRPQLEAPSTPSSGNASAPAGHAAAGGGVSPGAQARMALATTLLWQCCGRTDEALASAQAALAFAEATDDLHLRFQAYERYWWQQCMLSGPTDEAIIAFEGATPLAEAAGDLTGAHRNLINCAEGRWQRGEFDRARANYVRTLELAEHLQDWLKTPITYCNLGEIAFIEGHWAEARDHFERALALVRPASDDYCLISSRIETVRLAEGDALAGARLEAILAISPSNYDAEIWPRWALAERALVQGHPAVAARYAQPLLDRFEGQIVSVGLLRALVAWAALEEGDLEQAERLAERAMARNRAMHFHLALVDALRVQALVALRCARWDAAIAALDETLALARQMPYPYAEAKALFVYGQLHRAKGEPEQARACYEAARAILHRLGERLYLEQVERAMT